MVNRYTTTTSSYVSKTYKYAKNIKLDKNIKTKTYTSWIITHKREINLVGFDLTFLEINKLKDFAIILGVDALRKMKAKIDLFDYSESFVKVADYLKNEIPNSKVEEKKWVITIHNYSRGRDQNKK